MWRFSPDFLTDHATISEGPTSPSTPADLDLLLSDEQMLRVRSNDEVRQFYENSRDILSFILRGGANQHLEDIMNCKIITRRSEYFMENTEGHQLRLAWQIRNVQYFYLHWSFVEVLLKYLQNLAEVQLCIQKLSFLSPRYTIALTDVLFPESIVFGIREVNNLNLHDAEQFYQADRNQMFVDTRGPLNAQQQQHEVSYLATESQLTQRVYNTVHQGFQTSMQGQSQVSDDSMTAREGTSQTVIEDVTSITENNQGDWLQEMSPSPALGAAELTEPSTSNPGPAELLPFVKLTPKEEKYLPSEKEDNKSAYQEGLLGIRSQVKRKQRKSLVKSVSTLKFHTMCRKLLRMEQRLCEIEGKCCSNDEK